MNYPLIFGKYYRFLGWFSLASLVVSFFALPWTHYFHLDPSFLIWLWLGTELKEGKKSGWKWAIGISIFMLLAFALCAIFSAGNVTGWGKEFTPGSLGYYVIFAAIFILIILPGLLLLCPKAKHQFTNKT